MTITLKKGQKADITKNTSVSKIKVRLNWSTNEAHKEYDIDGAAFLLDSSGKVKSDDDCVFYNNLKHVSGSVTHSRNDKKDIRGSEDIIIDLKKVPNLVEKIAISLTINDGEIKKQNFGEINKIFLQVIDEKSGLELINYDLSSEFSKETAVVTSEVYRYNGEWKFNAIGAGFNGGLAALCKNFGVEVNEEENAQNTAIEPVKPTISPVRLEKITLDKKQSAFLKKSGKITVELEWEGKGDLDLYCFYVTQKDEVGKIYYRNLGGVNKYPFISLDGDSKVPGKETIQIANTNVLKYALFAAYSAVENGIGSFKSYKPKAIVTDVEGNKVVVPLLQKNTFSYWVAITLVDFINSSGIEVKHVEKYSKSFSERSPLLYKNGTFKMDAGEVEFKTIG